MRKRNNKSMKAKCCFIKDCPNPVVHTSPRDPKWGVSAISLCETHLDRLDEIHRFINSD